MTTKAILLLISLGMGYLIMVFARREKKAMRVTGFCLGTFIIAVSIVFILRYLWLYACSCRAVSTRPPVVQYELPKP
jgi:hypothetical protein